MCNLRGGIVEKKNLIELKKYIESLPKEEQLKRLSYLRALVNGEAQGPLTGYPSVDMPWLKHFRPDAELYVANSPVDKTVWDIIEQKLYEHYDYPALDYFGKIFSRQEFIDLCYTWARTFRAMGVEENEIVPIYGPFVPDICAMVFSLNMIGACPYFLKLDINSETLAEETKEAKIAVVFDGLWKNVAQEFSKEKFKNVIVATAPKDMPSPKKEIVSFMNAIQSIKNKSRIPDEKKYIWIDKATEIANYYSGDVKVPFVPNRSTFITSSSGTTIGGPVKGIIATNESVIAQLYMSDATDVQFFPGDKCLNHFPPTASTSLNTLFLLPLYRGMTVLINPRVSAKDFYNQNIKLKPNVSINTSSMWEGFFNRVEREIDAGKAIDLSYAKVWVVGGEGTDVRKIIRWNDIMHKCNNERGMVSAYGTSELFASTCTEKIDARCPLDKKIMSVGVPYAGLSIGVFDEFGNELSYNQRGNLWIKGKSLMKGYYGKPELTANSIEDGWFKTGDISEIDTDGFVYIWGREKDKIRLESGKDFYLFDVALKIKENGLINDAVVLPMPIKDNVNNLVSHIVWQKGMTQEEKVIALNEINNSLEEFLPEGVIVSAYSEHNSTLPYSPTTLKIDKNSMAKQTSGYIQVINDKITNVEFIENSNNERYIKYSDQKPPKIKVKVKK